MPVCGDVWGVCVVVCGDVWGVCVVMCGECVW